MESKRVTIAAEVRAVMARNQVSGRTLAKALDMTQAYIARRLSGEVEFSASELGEVAKYLNVPITTFYVEPVDA